MELRFIPKTQKTMNDIEITRRGFTNTEFANGTNVGLLIDHLGNYHEKESTGKPCHQNNCPECHGASHGADTFRYMHMAMHLGLVTPYLVPDKNKKQSSDFVEDDYFVC